MAPNCRALTLAAAAVFPMAAPAWSVNPVNSSELTLSAANVPPSPATAGQPDVADAVARARALIRELKFNEALAILRPQTRGGRVDTNVRFLFGIAAIEASRLPDVAAAERDALLDEAIAALRFMLIDRPGLVRVRLELARAFFYKGEDSLSRRHFERVLAGEPPPAVAANVQRFLVRIRARRGWRMHAGAAIAPDTNIGGTSAKRTLYIWGLPFQRDAEELTTSGVGISVWAGGEYRYPLDDGLRLRAGGDISRRDYAGERFDRLFLSGHAGPRWLVDRNTEVSLLASVRRRWTANVPYHDDLGLRVEAGRRLTRRVTAIARAAWHDRGYRTYKFLDGPVADFSLGGSWVIAPTLRADSAAGYGRERPKSERWRHDRRWLRLGLTVALPLGFTVGGSGEMRRTGYEGNWGFYTPGGEPRRDRTRSLRLSVHNRAFTVLGFSPRLSVVKEVRTTNAQLYDYKRTSGELSFVRQF